MKVNAYTDSEWEYIKGATVFIDKEFKNLCKKAEAICKTCQEAFGDDFKSLQIEKKVTEFLTDNEEENEQIVNMDLCLLRFDSFGVLQIGHNERGEEFFTELIPYQKIYDS